MKRLIAAGVAGLIALMMTFYSTNFIGRTADEITAKISVIRQNAAQEKSGGEEKQFEEYWDRLHPTLSLFINHEALSDIGFAAAQMTAAAKEGEYFKVIEAANEIDYCIREIHEDEQLYWYSFF